MDGFSRNDPPVAALSAFFKEVTFTPNRCPHHAHAFRDADAHSDAAASFIDDDEEKNDNKVLKPQTTGT